MNNEPESPTPAHNLTNDGMTLRDYFAAKAMHGLLAGTNCADGNKIVRDAYNIADAMLAAREVK